jgi:uncharacterized phiE125 gp8 family phage protein
MATRLITPPASEPVTLAEASAHLRLEHHLDDDYVAALIKAARKWAEAVCWCGFVTQTLELVLEEFPDDDELELPKGALASIASVKYIDVNGVEQTLASTEYEADTANVPGMLRLAYGKVWPSTRDQWNAVVVRYVVGTAVDAVPEPVKQALLLLVSQMYEHRTPEVTGASLAQVQFSVDALLGPYRLASFL